MAARSRSPQDYNVDEEKYADSLAFTKTIEALKGLNVAQISFLRAMVALGVKDWTPTTTLSPTQRRSTPGKPSTTGKKSTDDIATLVKELDRGSEKQRAGGAREASLLRQANREI